MQIDTIKRCCVNPVFMAKKPEKSSYNTQVQLDSYQKSKFSNDVDKFYGKIEKDLDIVSAEDVKKMAKNISVNTGYNLDEVYYAMGTLSQYSSYKSLKYLRGYFSSKDIKGISNLFPIYADSDFKPCLTNVMHYVGMKNLDTQRERLYKDINRALILDSELLKIYKNSSNEDKQTFEKEFVKNERIFPLYIKNFEKGYNFLNQSTDFKTYTIDILNKVKYVQTATGKDFKDSLDFVLNKKLIKDISGIGINPYILDVEIKTTPEEIADNLNPIMPKKEDIIKIVDMVSKRYKSASVEENKYEIMKFLNKMTIAVSPKQYCEYLKNLNGQINDFVNKKGKSQDDIIYLIPSKNKSYVLVNYQYFNLNKIKNPKIIYGYNYAYAYKDIAEKVPDGKVLVILDDCVMSGSSYLREMFEYRQVADTFAEQHKNVNILFAPIFGTEYGISKISGAIAENKRNNLDRILCTKKLPTWDENKDEYSVLYRYETAKENPYVTSIVFPYMGPDSNCEELENLYEKFFINPYAQKKTINCINYPVMY